MFRKLLKIAGSLALILFIVVTLAFTTHESRNVVCRDIEVDFDSNDIIKVDKDELIRIVKNSDKSLLGKKLNKINAEKIEAAVEKHPAIFNAEVYKVMVKDSTLYKGVLTVRVKHRVPVVRVMSDNGSYYLDELGNKIPISQNYTANVLVATGFFTEKYAKSELLPFVLCLKNNEFWNAQIEQVYVAKDGDVLLIPLVGEHIIEFGTLNDYREKLKKMKAFYEQVLAKNNWNKYTRISLKYKNQVVAKKR